MPALPELALVSARELGQAGNTTRAKNGVSKQIITYNNPKLLYFYYFVKYIKYYDIHFLNPKKLLSDFKWIICS